MAISTANVDAGSDSPRLARAQIKEAIDTVNNLETSAGSAGVGFIQSGTGAVATTVQTKAREHVSVLDFGAIGNGTTDCLAAFNAATTYCQDNLKALYIPGNSPSQYYKLTGPWVITKPITIVTDGEHCTTIFTTGLAVGQYAIDIDGTAYGTYEKANIGPMTIYAGSGDCLRIKNVSDSKIGKMVFATGRHGIVYTGTRSYSNDFEKPTNFGLTGYSVYFTAHTGGGQHNFWGGSLGGDTGLVVASDCDIDSLNFYDMNFEQCTTNSAVVSGTVRALNFHGGRTEGCNGVDFLIDPAATEKVLALNIRGVEFSSSDAGGSDRIQLGGSGGVVKAFVVEGCSVSHGTNNFSAKLVKLNGAGDTGRISNNYLDGLNANCAPVDTYLRNGIEVYDNEGRNGLFAPPTFSFTDGSGAGLTFSVSLAHYRVSGGFLHYQAVVTYPVTVDASNASLSGFPFAYIAGSSLQGRASSIITLTDAGIDVGFLHGSPNTTSMAMVNRLTNVAITNAQLSGKSLYFFGSFAVA